MENKVEFQEVEHLTNSLDDTNSIDEKVDILIDIVKKNNEVSKMTYDALIKTTNSNKRIFDSLGDTVGKLIDKVKDNDELINAQQGLNESLTVVIENNSKFINENHTDFKNSMTEIMKHIDLVIKMNDDLTEFSREMFKMTNERVEILESTL